MKQTVTIWRESVYKNGFKCNKCGKKLAKDGQPKRSVLTASKTPQGLLFVSDNLYCPRCFNLVGVMKEIDTDKELKPGLYGDFNEYTRKKMN